MRKAWLFACWGFVGISVIGACGGSSETDLFASSSSGDTSGATTSSSGATSASSTSSGGTSSGTTSSGSSGTSGTSGSSGTSGTSGASGNVDAGAKGCRPAVPTDCANNEYCKVSTCGQTTGGTCTKKPTALAQDFAPVCGCDDVTYWNTSIMAAFGVSAKAAGVCPQGKACNGLTKCPDKRYCNRDLGPDNQLLCPGLGESGTCWGLPPSCPALTGNRRPCGANPNQCKSFCDVIRAETPWYTDNNNCN